MQFTFENPPEVPLQLHKPSLLLVPKQERLVLWATVIGLVMIMMTFLALRQVYLPGLKRAADDLLPIVFIGLVLLSFLVHELVHGLAVPGGLFGPHCLIGLRLRKGFAYCWSPAPMPRSRYLVMALAPLVLLSALPLALYPFFPDHLWWLMPAILMNLGGSGGDLLMAYIVVRQVPAGNWMQSSAERDYHGGAPQGRA